MARIPYRRKKISDDMTPEEKQKHISVVEQRFQERLRLLATNPIFSSKETDKIKDQEKKQAYLETVLRCWGIETQALMKIPQELGVTAELVEKWKSEDEHLIWGLKVIQQIKMDSLEKRATNMAMDGDPYMLQFSLKALHPSYKDKGAFQQQNNFISIGNLNREQLENEVKRLSKFLPLLNKEETK